MFPVSMAYQPFYALGGYSAEAYGLRMKGEGHTYWERLRQRLRQRLHCP